MHRPNLAMALAVTTVTVTVMALLAFTDTDPTYTRDAYCHDTLHGIPRPDGCHLPSGAVITPTPGVDR